MTRPRVFICSPYGADTEEQRERNLQLARRLSRRAALHGLCPIAPHLMCPQFLQDEANERTIGMQCSLTLLATCSVLWACMPEGAWKSHGMSDETTEAERLGIPVIWVPETYSEPTVRAVAEALNTERNPLTSTGDMTT